MKSTLYCCLLTISSVYALVGPQLASITKKSSTFSTVLYEEAKSDSETPPKKEKLKAIILDPFPEAADPKYTARGPVGQDEFIVSREGGPKPEELTNENLLLIVKSQCSDLEANVLAWKCLGYRFDPDNEEWTNAEVFPKWKEKYPDPPDFIGMQRIYSKQIDGPSLVATQNLIRSIPMAEKQQLRKHLKPMGFNGFKIAQLTPNLTRRAQVCNWLLFYRDNLYGVSLEELLERRRVKQQKEKEEKEKKKDEEEEWSPPIQEVF